MTPAETTAVRATIRGLYSMFHRCSLRESEITADDKARGLKVGQLCDDCEQSIKAHMREIAKATGAAAPAAPSLALTAFIQDVEAAEGKGAQHG